LTFSIDNQTKKHGVQKSNLVKEEFLMQRLYFYGCISFLIGIRNVSPVHIVKSLWLHRLFQHMIIVLIVICVTIDCMLKNVMHVSNQ